MNRRFLRRHLWNEFAIKLILTHADHVVRYGDHLSRLHADGERRKNIRGGLGADDGGRAPGGYHPQLGVNLRRRGCSSEGGLSRTTARRSMALALRALLVRILL